MFPKSRGVIHRSKATEMSSGELGRVRRQKGRNLIDRVVPHEQLAEELLLDPMAYAGLLRAQVHAILALGYATMHAAVRP